MAKDSKCLNVEDLLNGPVANQLRAGKVGYDPIMKNCIRQVDDETAIIAQKMWEEERLALNAITNDYF